MTAPFVSAIPDGAVVADARFYLDGRSTRAAYEQGHLPGAVYVDTERWLSGAGSPESGRHPFPTPAVFAEGMRALGIGDESVVIAYDDAGGVMAARLVWMLRRLGTPAALLDGGMYGRDLVDGPQEPAISVPGQWTERPWPADAFATMDEVAGHLPDSQVLLDARPRARFTGEDPSGPDPQAGHIPGAQSLPVTEHSDAHGVLLPDDVLLERLRAAGVDGREVISSCGSGVTACHNLLVLEHLGLPEGRLYVGSWSQWSHTDRPIATGC